MKFVGKGSSDAEYVFQLFINNESIICTNYQFFWHALLLYPDRKCICIFQTLFQLHPIHINAHSVVMHSQMKPKKDNICLWYFTYYYGNIISVYIVKCMENFLYPLSSQNRWHHSRISFPRSIQIVQCNYIVWHLACLLIDSCLWSLFSQCHTRIQRYPRKLHPWK